MRQVTRTISREVVSSRSLEAKLTPQRLHAELLAVTASGSRAYLLGALHDATISHAHRTVRFGQSDERWLAVLKLLLEKLGQRSWMYREGKTRNFWILESSARWLEGDIPLSSIEEKLAYARGYFDAEGGVPKDSDSRFYIQFVQKNFTDIFHLHSLLGEVGIDCGRIHNPSVRKDPEMWRFYVLAKSHVTFVDQVGSWHPRKRHLLELYTQRSRPGW